MSKKSKTNRFNVRLSTFLLHMVNKFKNHPNVTGYKVRYVLFDGEFAARILGNDNRTH